MGNQIVLSQAKELAVTVIQGIPSDLSEETLAYILKNKSLLVEAVQKAIRDIELPRWREENGVIYFEVTSDGTTGPQWIERLEKQGFQLSRWAKDVLNSLDFKPTSGVTYQVAVLKGTLFADSDRTTKAIRAEAKRRGLVAPHPEVACLIRETFSDEELEAMGLWWIVVFHEPIKDPVGDPSLLGSCRDYGGRLLFAYFGRPYDHWNPDVGLAFAVPQVSSD